MKEQSRKNIIKKLCPMGFSPPSPEFLRELSTHGYSTERNFSEYKSKHNLKLSCTTPNYLSIDFHSR